PPDRRDPSPVGAERLRRQRHHGAGDPGPGRRGGPGMTMTALGLVLAAAVLHAAWNLLAKRAGGGAALVWLYGTASAALLTPPAVALLVLGHTDMEPTGRVYTLASAVLHVAY